MRREDVSVGDLVLGAFKARDVDEASFGQLGHAVVDFAEADAHLPGHVALAEVGLLAEDLEEAVADLLIACVHVMNIISSFSSCVKISGKDKKI